MRKKDQKKKDKLLEKERQILRETLDVVVQENAELKEMLAEVQANVNENKIQLQDKINSITDKETAVEMLTNQIDLLKQKFNELQITKQKMQSIINNNISEDFVPSKGNESTINGVPNTLMHKNIDDVKNQKDKDKKLKGIQDNINKQRLFLSNQQEIQNEINKLRKDVKFLQEKINENKNNYLYYQYNFNIENYFQKNDLNNLKKILNENDKKDKLIYLVTSDGTVYKIKKRDDLTKNNIINQIELDYFRRYKGNEVINIREKPDRNDKNSNNIITLANNNFNNNLQHIIKYNYYPNYDTFDSDDSYKDIDDLMQPLEIQKNIIASRNREKHKGMNSYVNDLLRGSFVL